MKAGRLVRRLLFDLDHGSKAEVPAESVQEIVWVAEEALSPPRRELPSPLITKAPGTGARPGF